MTKEEAINEIRSWYFLNGKEIEAVQTLIPELRESEDEEIYREIYSIVHHHYERKTALFVYSRDRNEMLRKWEKAKSYLEKHKEQKPADLSEMMVHKEPYIAPVPTPMVADEQKPVETSDFKTKLAEYLQNNSPKNGQYIISSESILEMAKEELIKRGELQKPVEWSEEDGWLAGEVLDMIKSNGRWVRSDDAVKQVSNWFNNRFKLLRPQPKPEVTDEEIEEMVTKRSKSSGTTKSEMAFYRNGIKDAIKQFGLRPQPKAELTLLDENIIKAAVAFVEQNDHFNYWRGIDKHTVIKALRSIKPHWKPSELEKGALRTAIHILTDERSFPKAAAQLQNILDAFEGKESRKDWKPTKEQMDALHEAVIRSCSHRYGVKLLSLEVDLLNLKRP